MEVMIISRELWINMVSFLYLKFNTLEKVLFCVFLSWIFRWWEVKHVFIRTPVEAWIHCVVNITLYIEILSCPSSCNKFYLEPFFLSKFLWQWDGNWGIIYLSFKYGITSGMVMCVNECMLLEKVQRNFPYVVELQIGNLNYYIQT